MATKLFLLVVVGLLEAGGHGANAIFDFLNPLTVVTFPNAVCSGTTRSGICYTADECTTNGGAASGSCAEGFGVCCVFELACGQRSSQNCTFLTRTTAAAAGSNCVYRIAKANSKVCRIRFDFTTLVLAGPQVGTVVDVGAPDETLGPAIGHCMTDSLFLTGSPIICGTNTGEHMIVDAASNDNILSLGIGSSTATWDIKVTQYDCPGSDDTNGGPRGCLQYFTANTGTIKSYNFPAAAPITASATHLANQDYNICIKRNIGKCAICYTPTTDVTEAAATQDSFGLSVGLPLRSGTDGCIGTNCLTDYIVIPQATTMAIALPATAGVVAVNPVNSNRIGGRFFGTTNMGTAHDTICSSAAPFRVYFHTDGNEETVGADSVTNEQLDANGGIVGFSLDYVQHNCP